MARTRNYCSLYREYIIRQALSLYRPCLDLREASYVHDPYLYKGAKEKEKI
jgi:hypothetical protein